VRFDWAQRGHEPPQAQYFAEGKGFELPCDAISSGSFWRAAACTVCLAAGAAAMARAAVMPMP
jgi:hypothetical protein